MDNWICRLGSRDTLWLDLEQETTQAQSGQVCGKTNGVKEADKLGSHASSSLELGWQVKFEIPYTQDATGKVVFGQNLTLRLKLYLFSYFLSEIICLANSSRFLCFKSKDIIFDSYCDTIDYILADISIAEGHVKFLPLCLLEDTRVQRVTSSQIYRNSLRSP